MTDYLSGFGNEFATEALPGALPHGQNSPQRHEQGLYAEQVNGSAFTAVRGENIRSWLYRIRPSVLHSEYQLLEHPYWNTCTQDHPQPIPNQMRWSPLPEPKAENKLDWIAGMKTFALNGSAASQSGCAVHLYSFNQSMNRFFYNADGELLFVPQKGRIRLHTEMGKIDLEPLEIACVPRGLKFRVELLDAVAQGYVGENFGKPLRLPNLGPIGANGLANPRDFLTPVACFEDQEGDFEIVAKFCDRMWCVQTDHSPLDVVGWHGNLAPYKYDLRLFHTINAVRVDHPDPSIFTVLTSPSDPNGTANLDFVIFPPRWMVAENTFRPPYYHRNYMSEFMGLIQGQYDAKPDGFSPGGSSLHNCMSGHGPDASTFEAATQASLAPERYKDTMAFMFESRYVFQTTQFALNTDIRQKDYLSCWKGLKKQFSGSN